MVDEKQTADMLEAERQATLEEVRRRVVELKSRDCFGATYGECGEDVLAIIDSMKDKS